MATIPQHSYLAALGDRDPIEVISQTPTRIQTLLARFTSAQLEQKPAPDRWSVRELICHWADAEIGWAWRLRKTMEDAHHLIQPWNENSWSPAYSRYTLAQARATFEALRAWNVAFIQGSSDAEKRKPVMHPEHGEWTMWTIVQMMAGHDQHHLKKLETRVK